MAVFRVEKTRDFTVMSNHHLRNTALSLKAKGLMSLMLSLPEEWNYTTKGLAGICKDGVDSISAAINELERHGYLTRRRLRDGHGRLGDTEYTVHERPVETKTTESETIESKTTEPRNKKTEAFEQKDAESKDAPPAAPVRGANAVKDEPAVTPKRENPVQAKNSPKRDFPVQVKPILEKPVQEKPVLGKPVQENPAQLNTKLLNTKNKSSTYESNTYELNTQSINPSINPYLPYSDAQSGGRDMMDGIDGMDMIEAYRSLIMENVGHGILAKQYGRERMDEVVELILETVLSRRDYIRIAGDDFPGEAVKSRMLKVSQFHVEYVFDCIDKSATEIRNIKAYLLTALYNAPATMNSHYRAAVNYDMYGEGRLNE